jgi:hypothetical protein
MAPQNLSTANLKINKIYYLSDTQLPQAINSRRAYVLTSINENFYVFTADNGGTFSIPPILIDNRVVLVRINPIVDDDAIVDGHVGGRSKRRRSKRRRSRKHLSKRRKYR